MFVYMCAFFPDFFPTNNILYTFLSAYVPNKSTETAITRVTTNILCDLNIWNNSCST